MITLPLLPVYAWLLVFLRVGMILSIFPVIGERFVPVRVRIVLAMVVAFALAPVAPVSGAAFPATAGGLLALVVQEMLLAVGVALVGRIMFGIVQFSGQLAGEQMGFGMVNSIDPTGSHQVSVVAELQYVMALLIFFSASMHHPLLRLIAWSFSQLPPGTAIVTSGLVDLLMRLGTTMFALSLGFAMPVIVVIFSINIGLGMVARAVPQINVFMESFPLRIIAGLSVLMMTVGMVAVLWERMFDDMQSAMIQVVRLMQGS